MRELFSAYPEAVENTAKSLRRCNVEFTFGKYHLPEFQLPAGYDSLTYLKELCDKGYQERYGDDAPRVPRADGIRDRHDREDGLYRLLPHRLRLCELRQKAGIPVGPGRGSAAGSHGDVCAAHHRHRPDEVRPLLRAVFEPGAGDHARYRHGLRRHAARRGGGLRPAQIRRRPCGADRHLRHHGRPGRHPRRGPGAELHLCRDGRRGKAGAAATPHITLDEALRVSPPLREMYEQDARVQTLIDTARPSRVCRATRPPTPPASSSRASRSTTMCPWRQTTTRSSPSIP